MYIGIVKFFDPRGFGFIEREDGEQDIYFHVSELPGKRGARHIEDGTPVTFELGTFKTPDNVVAKKVRPIDGTPSAFSGGGSDEQQ
jgi:CspA family cold shock protein